MPGASSEEGGSLPGLAGREDPHVWRVVGVLVALVVALSILGLVIKAVRFLLIVAVVLAVLSAIAGITAGRKP